MRLSAAAVASSIDAHRPTTTTAAESDDSSDPAQPRVIPERNSAFLKAELLQRTNFVALVLSSNPNSVVIWDAAKQTVLLEYREESRILAVKWRYDRIIITLLTKVKVYTFSPSPYLLYTFPTMTNDYGLTCVSPSSQSLPSPTNASISSPTVILAFQGRNTGQIQYCQLPVNPLPLEKPTQPYSLAVSIIPAHSGPLKSIAVSNTGKYIASSSTSGTLIRVFDTTTRSLLHEFRRGTENAIIYNIQFSWNEQFMVVGSDRGTVHVFIVGSPNITLDTTASTSIHRAQTGHPAETDKPRIRPLHSNHLLQSHNKHQPQNGGISSPSSAPPSLAATPSIRGGATGSHFTSTSTGAGTSHSAGSQGNRSSSLQFLSPLNKYFNSQWSFAQCVLEPDCGPFVCGFGGMDGKGEMVRDGVRRAVEMEKRKRSGIEDGSVYLTGSAGSDFEGVQFPNDGFVKKEVAVGGGDLKQAVRWSPGPANPVTSIVVVSEKGAYYKFALDMVKGGECVLERFHMLDKREDSIGTDGDMLGIGDRVGDISAAGVEFGMQVVQ
ncbi:WD repeat domain phosphoinositide-interacting protein 3 [Rhizoclosmatium sp. JEL0117]|nr:WD repeat domain phosphoinositide-interacting protein 3 [Rhizoclosmatium sp. JEL0117]